MKKHIIIASLLLPMISICMETTKLSTTKITNQQELITKLQGMAKPFEDLNISLSTKNYIIHGKCTLKPSTQSTQDILECFNQDEIARNTAKECLTQMYEELNNYTHQELRALPLTHIDNRDCLLIKSIYNMINLKIWETENLENLHNKLKSANTTCNEKKKRIEDLLQMAFECLNNLHQPHLTSAYDKFTLYFNLNNCLRALNNNGIDI